MKNTQPIANAENLQDYRAGVSADRPERTDIHRSRAEAITAQGAARIGQGNGRINANIGLMIDKGADESQIDTYLQSEDVGPKDLGGVSTLPKAPPSALQNISATAGTALDGLIPAAGRTMAGVGWVMDTGKVPAKPTRSKLKSSGGPAMPADTFEDARRTLSWTTKDNGPMVPRARAMMTSRQGQAAPAPRLACDNRLFQW